MKKIKNVSLVALLMVVFFGCISQAEDLDAVIDKFYAGLADIIEQNMDNPETCIEEVEFYYSDNKKITKQIKEALKRANPAIEKYESMSKEELESILEQQEANLEKQLSSGLTRYNQALQDFSTEHPDHAAIIAIKALQLFPGSYTELY